MSFGENVRREREAMNMTQEQLGEAVGVSLQMISYIERERRNTDGGFCFAKPIVLLNTGGRRLLRSSLRAPVPADRLLRNEKGLQVSLQPLSNGSVFSNTFLTFL